MSRRRRTKLSCTAPLGPGEDAQIAKSGELRPEALVCVDGHLLKLFMEAVRPVDFNIDRPKRAESEVQAGGIARIEAELAKQRLSLYLSPVADQNTSTNGAAV